MTPSAQGVAPREELVGVVGWPQPTSRRLVEAWRELGMHAGMLSPAEASSLLGPHDVAVGRLDVRTTLDGVQPGLQVLAELERRDVRVINRAEALMNAHDKLRSARLLTGAGLPHPKTAHITSLEQDIEIAPPVVVKPRFGSWGADVFRCETRDDLARTLATVSSRPWFVRHGALVQELVPPTGYDLRLVVAAGQAVGATERVARRGEWRTNVSLGATRRPTRPSREACALATTAATLIGADLVGVDLLPVAGGYIVLELNGAVEFDRSYDLEDSNVFAAAASALRLPRPAPPRSRRSLRARSLTPPQPRS